MTYQLRLSNDQIVEPDLSVCLAVCMSVLSFYIAISAFTSRSPIVLLKRTARCRLIFYMENARRLWHVMSKLTPATLTRSDVPYFEFLAISVFVPILPMYQCMKDRRSRYFSWKGG